MTLVSKNMIKNNRQKKVDGGSFLLELLVAFAIISVSLVVVVDSFILSQRSYIDTSDRSGLSSVLSYVLEDITREARVSDNYRISDAGGLLMTRIKGLNGQNEDDVSYTLVDSVLQKQVGVDVAIPITPPVTDILVTSFDVQILGGAVGEFDRILVSVSAEVKDHPETSITMQTTLTERLR